jgi:NAD(P)-dependent dehydrogenase (short-subunit alcohol dehydrogenase family)
VNSDFDNKAGLVTGASGGIGRASAVALAAAGASVAVADLESRRQQGEETVSIIRTAGGTAHFVATDVTREASVEELIADVAATYGAIDFALNNAGVAAQGMTSDLDEAYFDHVVSVDLKGVWLCMKHELLHMKANGGGSIVNTASTAGLTGFPMASPYASAKHGVVGLTRTAAAEYANMGIRVNAVAPGAIRTRMMTELPDHAQELLIAPQPLHRFGEPEEVAAAALFLLSERASFIVGAVLPVDGGFVATSSSYHEAFNPSA